MEQYEMPEFAVVGNVVYVESKYSTYDRRVTRGTITKVFKTGVDFKYDVTGIVERYTLKAWTSKLSLKGFSSSRYLAPRVLSETEGLERNARIDSAKKVEQARYRVESVASDISKRVKNCNMETLDTLMNELKTSVEELRELEK